MSEWNFHEQISSQFYRLSIAIQQFIFNSMDGTAILSKLSTANNRIYVGNLCSAVNTAIINGKFSVHGRIIGISQKGLTFCFIEYDNSRSARSAIEFENQSYFCGRKIVVRQAMSKNEPHTSCEEAFGENDHTNGNENNGNRSSKWKCLQVCSARSFISLFVWYVNKFSSEIDKNWQLCGWTVFITLSFRVLCLCWWNWQKSTNRSDALWNCCWRKTFKVSWRNVFNFVY